MTVRVKICGVTRVDDAIASVEAGADLIGLNFFAASPRYLSIEGARVVREAIGRRIKVVGVFVNASRDYVDERLRALGLDLLQFSGDEDDAILAGWPAAGAAAVSEMRIGSRVRARTAAMVGPNRGANFQDALR